MKSPTSTYSRIRGVVFFPGTLNRSSSGDVPSSGSRWFAVYLQPTEVYEFVGSVKISCFYFVLDDWYPGRYDHTMERGNCKSLKKRGNCNYCILFLLTINCPHNRLSRRAASFGYGSKKSSPFFESRYLETTDVLYVIWYNRYFLPPQAFEATSMPQCRLRLMRGCAGGESTLDNSEADQLWMFTFLNLGLDG